MTIKQRLRRVELAESNCRTRSEKARAGLNSLKQNFRDAATPWRIVTVGVIAGFFVGRSGDGGGVASGVGAKLFGSVAQALITALGTGATAGVAASAAADAAATATSAAVAEESQSAETAETATVDG